MADNTAVEQQQDGERGLGKAFLAGVGGVAAYVAYKKATKKRKKHVKSKDGRTREIDCDVLVDETGNELPGQEFDEQGRCINEDEVISKVNNNPENAKSNAGATLSNDDKPGYLAGVDAKKVPQ